jgi:hypothetical protein
VLGKTAAALARVLGKATILTRFDRQGKTETSRTLTLSLLISLGELKLPKA